MQNHGIKLNLGGPVPDYSKYKINKKFRVAPSEPCHPWSIIIIG